MAKFKCIRSTPRTTICKGAIVSGEYEDESKYGFILKAVENNLCSEGNIGASMPMTGNLWSWEEVK